MICMCDCFKHAPYRIYAVANALEVVTHSYFCDKFFAALHTNFTRAFFILFQIHWLGGYISASRRTFCACPSIPDPVSGSTQKPKVMRYKMEICERRQYEQAEWQETKPKQNRNGKGNAATCCREGTYHSDGQSNVADLKEGKRRHYQAREQILSDRGEFNADAG